MQKVTIEYETLKINPYLNGFILEQRLFGLHDSSLRNRKK